MGAPHTGWTLAELSTETHLNMYSTRLRHTILHLGVLPNETKRRSEQRPSVGRLRFDPEVGNVPVSGGKYRINVTIPSRPLWRSYMYVGNVTMQLAKTTTVQMSPLLVVQHLRQILHHNRI